MTCKNKIPLQIREVSFFTTKEAPEIWGEHMNFGNQKEEQNNFCTSRGGGGGGREIRRSLQILLKNLRNQNINLY